MSMPSAKMADSTMAMGSTTKPVGIGVEMPQLVNSMASRNAKNAPDVISSEWAKWAKRRMPKISVMPMAPSA
ncbi:hypothetical protein D3C72_2129890 [compost metagenome]